MDITKNKISEEDKKSDVKINRRYKDRLFRFRFGSDEYKKDVLSVYNALNDVGVETPD